ncbi:MAG TPA: hypothetical protein VGL71_04735, partial [Urbifossiella sp.]
MTGRKPPPRQLRLEWLESRDTPNTYVVTTAADPSYTSISYSTGRIADSGTYHNQVSLRSAIDAANHTAGADTIVFSNVTSDPYDFSPPLAETNFYGSVQTITLGSALPTITDSVAIVGAAPALTVVSAGYGFRAFTVDDSGASAALSVTLGNMTIDNGYLVGATMAATGYDVVGGAIAFSGGTQTGDTLTIANCDVSHNSIFAGTTLADGIGGYAYGGALYATGVAVDISQSVFSCNYAEGGWDQAVLNFDNRP